MRPKKTSPEADSGGNGAGDNSQHLGGQRKPSTAKARRKFLSVVDWEQLAPNHIGKKYPWARFYLSGSRECSLDDPRYMALTKSQRADYWHLVMLAGKFGNLVPDDPATLAFLLRESDPLDSEALVNAGLVRRRAAGRATANGRQQGVRDKAGEADSLGKADSLVEASLRPPAAAADETICINLSDQPEPYPLPPAFLTLYGGRFPGVNVREQIKKFAVRVAANPDGRPTLAGLNASITGWLQKAAGFQSGAQR